MEQQQAQTFNVDSWLAQGKDALTALHARKHAIAAKRVELEKEEAQIDEQIKSIEAVFGTVTPERRTGVIDLCREVVKAAPWEKDGAKNLGLPEDDLVRLVLERDPLMKDSSIRNALRNLAKKDELDRFGKRGSYRYRPVQTEGEVPSEAVDKASPEERIETKLISVGKDGATIRDLAYIVGDQDHALLILDEMIGNDRVETFPVGEGEFRYRLKEAAPAPGSNGKTDPEEDEPQSSMFG